MAEPTEEPKEKEKEKIDSSNFFKKVAPSSATPEEQEGKIVVSNGLFVQCQIQLDLVSELRKLRLK